MIPQHYPLYARVWSDDPTSADGWWAIVIGWRDYGAEKLTPVLHDIDGKVSGGTTNTWTPNKNFEYQLFTAIEEHTE